MMESDVILLNQLLDIENNMVFWKDEITCK